MQGEDHRYVFASKFIFREIITIILKLSFIYCNYTTKKHSVGLQSELLTIIVGIINYINFLLECIFLGFTLHIS